LRPGTAVQINTLRTIGSERVDEQIKTCLHHAGCSRNFNKLVATQTIHSLLIRVVVHEIGDAPHFHIFVKKDLKCLRTLPDGTYP
jgi:hypothetical protein